MANLDEKWHYKYDDHNLGRQLQLDLARKIQMKTILNLFCTLDP